MVRTFEGKTKDKYGNVKLPAEMVSEIRRIIETEKRLGFTSTQEFVKEATRRSIALYGGIDKEGKNGKTNE